MQDIGTLGGGASEGVAINSNGQVTGDSLTRTTGEHAFLYSNGVMQDLGTLGGAVSFGTAINENGQVVGWSRTSSVSDHAFLYVNGMMQDLGTLVGGNNIRTSSYANGINASGQVVGASDIVVGGGSATHAVLFGNGQVIDLNTTDTTSALSLYVTLTNATAINNNGWIVADGIDSRSGQTHAYLLAPVPLPAAIWLMLSACGGLFGLVHRRRIN
jgi:probable HAF family extracellular repeat protein